MKNLKKVLALVLAFACAFTMFAGAAFTDAADIKATEAVDTLVALGVIKGYEDGSFRPDATVTRAEMAKMIYVLRTGKDDASAYAAAATKFDDLNGASTSWAAGYIKYCEALGIIAGKSATKFDPAATVTGEEAAKMLLVTLGYDAEKAGLIGTSWAKTTIALADENGLLDDVNAPLSLALPRQYAAQMIFNAIDAYTVKMTDGEYSNMNIIGNYYPTIGEKYMGLKKAVGTLTTVTKDGDTYKVVIEQSADDKEDSTNAGDVSFTKVAKDYTNLRDQKVKVLYKAKDNVYGIYAVEDSDVLSGILGNFSKSDAKLKFDGTKYTVKSDAIVKENGIAKSGVDTAAELLTYVDDAAGLNKTFVATTLSDDDKISTLNVKTHSIAKVTYVGKDYVNTTKVAGDTFTKIDTDSSNYPSDLKKDDYVVVYNKANFADDKQVVEKLNVVEGKITSTKNGKAADDYSIYIDGVWYEMAMAKDSGNAYVGNAEIALADTVKVVVKDGYVVYIDDANASSSDVALLVKAVAKNSASGDSIEARVIFADGKDEIVTAKEEGVLADINNTTNKGTIDEAQLVSYKKSGSKYVLTAISGAISGYDDYATDAVRVKSDKLQKKTVSEGTTTYSNAAISYINNDATVFVSYNGGDDYKVITGSSLKNWKESAAFTAQVLAKKTNGLLYAKTAYINLGDSNMSGGKDLTFGYVLEDSKLVDENDTSYTTTLIWNGSEELTLKVEDGDALTEGQVVEYSTNSDGTYDIDNTYALTYGAVTGFDYNATDVEGYVTGKAVDSDLLATSSDFSLNISKDDYDTVVLFVDTDNAKGATSGEFQKADQNNDGKLQANIGYYANSNNAVVVVVDTQNLYTK